MTEHLGDLFLARVDRARQELGTRDYAFSGDTARCLWMLRGIPGGSTALWKRICHPWPPDLEAVGAAA
ncbi:MAG: hypothetical protein AB1758_35195, partial [Candidatus Eremiobacterota bacterium]